MVRKFEVTDLVGNRELDCKYHGTHNVHLEGRILREENDKLVVGLSLWPEDVAMHSYNFKEKSWDVFYQPPPSGTVRISILKLTNFEVPKQVKAINVYDMTDKDRFVLHNESSNF